MKHRTFGRSVIQVPEIVFGASNVGRHSDSQGPRDEALRATEMGPLSAAVLARLDQLYESDFGWV